MDVFLQEHLPKCPYVLASAGVAPVECEHGFDCCPICDPCTCLGEAERLLAYFNIGEDHETTARS